MKKRDLAKLALLGLASGMMISHPLAANEGHEGGGSEGSESKETLLARGGCSGGCGAGYQSQGQQGRDRRYNGQIAQSEFENRRASSCHAASSCQNQSSCKSSSGCSSNGGGYGGQPSSDQHKNSTNGNYNSSYQNTRR